MRDAYLVLTSAFFFFTALSSAFAPAVFAGRLGLAAANAGGVNEIRSQYAGFFLAAGMLCVLALYAVVPRQTALVMLAVIFGGLLLGRLGSLAVNGGLAGFGPTICALYVIDGLGFLAAAWLLRFTPNG